MGGYEVPDQEVLREAVEEEEGGFVGGGGGGGEGVDGDGGGDGDGVGREGWVEGCVGVHCGLRAVGRIDGRERRNCSLSSIR